MTTPVIQPQAIRDYRNSSRLTQAELAAILDMPLSRVTQWENGQTPTDEEQLILQHHMEKQEQLQNSLKKGLVAGIAIVVAGLVFYGLKRLFSETNPPSTLNTRIDEVNGKELSNMVEQYFEEKTLGVFNGAFNFELLNVDRSVNKLTLSLKIDGPDDWLIYEEHRVEFTDMVKGFIKLNFGKHFEIESINITQGSCGIEAIILMLDPITPIITLAIMVVNLSIEIYDRFMGWLRGREKIESV